MNICKKCIHNGICYMQKDSVTGCNEYNETTEKRGVWFNVVSAENGARRFICSNCCKTTIGYKKPNYCKWCGSKNKK